MESQTSEYPNQYYTPYTVFLRLQCPNAIGPVCKGTLSQLLTDISTVSWVHAYFCILIYIPVTRSRLAACTRPVGSRMATCLVIRICKGFRRGLHGLVYIGQPATVCHFANIQLRNSLRSHTRVPRNPSFYMHAVRACTYVHVQMIATPVRGGAGISKVVRPLQIKDHPCMCTAGGWGEGLQQAMCGSRNYVFVESKCVGADAVRLGCARLLIHRQKSGNDYEKCVHAQGKGELALDTWPNRLVLRLSLQSENETNVLLKSGPALAGPAGPATPPLPVVGLF